MRDLTGVKIRDLMELSDDSYQTGVRDGLRLAAKILTGCTEAIRLKIGGPNPITEFADIVAQVLEEHACTVHAQLEDQDKP